MRAHVPHHARMTGISSLRLCGHRKVRPRAARDATASAVRFVPVPSRGRALARSEEGMPKRWLAHHPGMISEGRHVKGVAEAPILGLDLDARLLDRAHVDLRAFPQRGQWSEQLRGSLKADSRISRR